MNLMQHQVRQKEPPFKSRELRRFAMGKECQMKSEWCSFDWSTVVLCHSRRLAYSGANEKPHDFWGYHGCAACHANEHKLEFKELYNAICRTQYAVYAEFGTLTPPYGRQEGAGHSFPGILTWSDFRDQERARRKAYLTGQLARCEWDVARTASAIGMQEDRLRLHMQDNQIEKED